ncbi:MAG: LamG domain-containing protein, partial [Ignavibacteriae bacterium]|nr:LamG domain-containing protein [Ignavibacteriota bacterium]
KSMNIIDDTNANILFDEISVGKWNLSIEAFNNDNYVIYSGNTEVNVLKGTITPISLQLNPTTGSIFVNVTWGANSFENIMAFYPFLGNANDFSGNQNHGIIYGPVAVDDRFGNSSGAYLFDGIDDYIKILDSDNLSAVDQQLTIATWVKVIDGSNKFILYKGSSLYNREYAFGIRPDSKASFHINNNGLWDKNQIGVPSNSIINNGEWYFIVGTWNGNEFKIYINGNLENSLKTNAQIGNYNSDLFIGTYGGKINEYAFKGIIDDIIIFNKELSSSEIDYLYSTTKSEVLK